MTTVEAHKFLSSIADGLEQDYDIKVQVMDWWNPAAGEYNPEKNILYFPMFGLRYLKESSPNSKVEDSNIYSCLDAIGHEIEHNFCEEHLNELSFDLKLYSLIDNELHNYYSNDPRHNKYYQNDLCELDAELSGLLFANSILSEVYDKKDVDRIAVDYVNSLVNTKRYYLQDDYFGSFDDVLSAFDKQKAELKNFDYPKPDM